MFRDPTFMCIDAGGDNCPCSLAESGNCIVCGRLSGQDCSYCRWQGVCIYNEYIQGGKRIKNNRHDIEARIVERAVYGDTLYLGIAVEKGFAIRCCPPGIYVFLRAKDRAEYFNVPVSVMRADTEKGIIYLLIKCISAKTKSLLKAEKNVIVRGPYGNGILGMETVTKSLKAISKNDKRGRLLIIARSAGIAPASKLMQVFGIDHDITLMLDIANIPEAVTEKYIYEEPDDYYELDLTKEQDLGKAGEEISSGKFDCIAVLTSDYFINKFGDMAEKSRFKGAIAVSNNFNICCGEGVCGACSVAGKNGETIKMCKCKLSGEEALKRKVIYK